MLKPSAIMSMPYLALDGSEAVASAAVASAAGPDDVPKLSWPAAEAFLNSLVDIPSAMRIMLDTGHSRPDGSPGNGARQPNNTPAPARDGGDAY
jgi:hypothetical protein